MDTKRNSYNLLSLKKGILFSIILGVIVFLGISIYGEGEKIIQAFLDFTWWLLPIVLGLAFLNYLIRFIKWEYYLKILDIKVSKKQSFLIFMSGLIMTITPGKFGELLKSYLLKQVNQTPISKSMPIVFAERLTDFISLIILSAIGISIFSQGIKLLIITGSICLAMIIILSWKKLFLSIINALEKINLLKKITDKIKNLYISTYLLISPKKIIIATLLSVIAWFFECLGFYLVIYGFAATATLLESTFIYSFSTIAGALSFLPGGLVATEASMAGFLTYFNGIAKDTMAAIVLITRAATLWFAVIIGLISFILFQKKNKSQVDH